MNKYSLVPVIHKPTGVMITCKMEIDEKGDWLHRSDVKQLIMQVIYDIDPELLNKETTDIIEEYLGN